MTYTSIHITADELWKACKMHSSYEGREAYDANGESLYPDVHITDQDKDLITGYISTAGTEIIASISNLIDSGSIAGDLNITLLQPIDEAHCANLKNQITETLSSSVMVKWLSNQIPSRVQFYVDLFAEMMTELTRILIRCDAPKKHRRQKPVTETTISIITNE